MAKEEDYRTKDQQVAALLHAIGHKLVATEWESNTCHFIFENSEACLLTVFEYLNGKVKVDAKRLFDSLNSIKAILYSK